MRQVPQLSCPMFGNGLLVSHPHDFLPRQLLPRAPGLSNDNMPTYPRT
jgi:hypothetical protein